MQTIAALVPLVLVCAALALRRTAITAALLGIGSIVILSIFVFPYDQEMVLTTVEALWMPIIEIALIVLGGILISEVLEAVGAQRVITEKLIAATGTTERATLLMAIGLVPFLESSIGYGLGIIITVPLLRKMGHSPTKSVALSLFGLTLTPWGSLGPGLIIAAELGGISINDLGRVLAILTIVTLIVLNNAVLVIAVKREKIRRYVLEVFVTTLVMWGALLLSNYYISVPLGGIFAALIAILTLLLIARIRGTQQRGLFDRTLLISASPYLVIIVGVVLSSILVPLAGIPLFTRIATSPATWLILSALISSRILGIRSVTMRQLLANSGRRWLKPGTIIMLYMIFGALLTASGMSTALAEGAAQLGLWNLLLIPGVNVIAGYVTASGSASAAMFSQSSAQMAQALGLSKEAILALQTIANTEATLVAPSRFALSAAALSSIAERTRDSEDDTEIVATETGPIAIHPHDSDVEQVQVGKITFWGLTLVVLMLPFWVGITWLIG